MYIATSHITRGGTTYTRPLRRESSRAHGKVLHRTMAHVRHGAAAEITAIRLALRGAQQYALGWLLQAVIGEPDRLGSESLADPVPRREGRDWHRPHRA